MNPATFSPRSGTRSEHFTTTKEDVSSYEVIGLDCDLFLRGDDELALFLVQAAEASATELVVNAI